MKQASGTNPAAPFVPLAGGSSRAFLVALVCSALLHAGSLYAAGRWGACFCSFGKVVCPKPSANCEPRVNIRLAPPPRQKPPEPPKPAVVVEQPKPDRPLAAPKAGKVVLPDEAFRQTPPRPADIKLDRPALPEEVVAKESEAKAPLIATGEIFDRAGQLTPGPPGAFGLGGTGTAVGAGPFGVEKEGGSGRTSTAAPVPEPPPPEPSRAPPSPKGPSRPPRVLDWTDPVYPAQARQQGIEGTVVLKLTVAADGRPTNVTVNRSSGSAALDEAAVEHVRKARFSPALKDGEPVAMTIAFRVRFRLVNT